MSITLSIDLLFLVFFHDFDNLQHSRLGPSKVNKESSWQKKLVFNFRENETNTVFVMDIPKKCYLLLFMKYIHFRKNLIHNFFFVLSSVSFVPLVRLKDYMHVSYWNHFKPFSVPAIFIHFSLEKNKQPLLAIFHKVNIQITIF